MDELKLNNKIKLTPDIFRERMLNRAVPPRYYELASGVQMVDSPAPYSDHIKADEVISTVSEMVKDGIVLDLGCGQKAEKMYRIAMNSGAKMYIGVDRFMPGLGIEHIGEKDLSKTDFGSSRPSSKNDWGGGQALASEAEKEEDRIRISETEEGAVLFEEDMLVAISQIPDNTLSMVTASGIENFARESHLNMEYFAVLKSEINRVLKPEGFFLSYHSDIHIPAGYKARYEFLDSIINGRVIGGIFSKN